mgnify:FL=1
MRIVYWSILLFVSLGVLQTHAAASIKLQKMMELSSCVYHGAAARKNLMNFSDVDYDGMPEHVMVFKEGRYLWLAFFEFVSKTSHLKVMIGESTPAGRSAVTLMMIVRWNRGLWPVACWWVGTGLRY